MHLNDRDTDPTLPHQMATSLDVLSKMIDVPSVRAILTIYNTSFTFLPSKEFCQADKIKIIESYLNLGYKLDRNKLEKILFHNYRHLNQLTSVKVEWKDMEGTDVEHSIVMDKIILYANPKIVDHRNLASWAYSLTNSFQSVYNILIPNDWLCSSTKRKREDQNEDAPSPKRFKSSSSARSSEQDNLSSEDAEMEASDLIPHESSMSGCILNLMRDGRRIVVNGSPNEPWNQSVFTHVFNHFSTSTMELPIEYLCSATARISSEVVDDALGEDEDYAHVVSIALNNTNDQKLDNDLAYLNSLKNLTQIVVKIESEEDIPFLIKIALEAKRNLKIDLKADGFTQNFDCYKLTTELLLQNPIDPYMLLTILWPFILAFPERQSTVSALSHLLEKEYVIDELIEGNTLKSRSYHEIETLMTFVDTHKQEWICYPKFLLTVFKEFIQRKDSNFSEVDKSFEQFFIYLLDNKVLSLENCDFLRNSHFVEWIIKMLLSKNDHEASAIAKNLLFLSHFIVEFCQKETTYARSLAKIASLFITHGYIPPYDEKTSTLKIFYRLLFPVLTKWIPHTSPLKNQWVYQICATFFPYEGKIDNNTQQMFCRLLIYNNFEKRNPIVFVDPKYINRELFFALFKMFIIHHKYMCEVVPFDYFQHLEKYIVQLRKYVTDTQTFYESIFPILTIVEEQMALQNAASQYAQEFAHIFFLSLQDQSYPGLQEKLLKKMVSFSKEPYKKRYLRYQES